MALWADNTSSEAQADLDAILALKESAAAELKEKGNEYMKMGTCYYKDAVDCYSRAIDQKSMDAFNTAILYANRSQAHLLLGNYRWALNDAREALKLNQDYIKAYFRGAKAALALNSFEEAIQLCSSGLKLVPENGELAKLNEIAIEKLLQAKESKKHESNLIFRAEILLSAFLDRNVKMGKPTYKQHTAGRKPWLDESKLLHWPVLFLYPEAMTTDLVEDFCEVDTFSSHLDVIFEDDTVLHWDHEHKYTRDNIQVFYEVNTSPTLSKKQMFCYLLEDNNVSISEDIQDLELCNHETGTGIKNRWVQVSERSTLHDVLAMKDYAVAGVPVFYILSKASKFYEGFVTGRWSAP